MGNLRQLADRQEIPIELRDTWLRVQNESERFINTSDPSALDAAISACEEVLAHPSFFASDVYFVLDAFRHTALALATRYSIRGDATDLDRVVSLLQQAVQRAPNNWSELPAYFSHLGSALRDRYACTGQFADLEEAIRACYAAVDLTLVGSSLHPEYLSDLGRVLYARYSRTGQPEHLDEAIEVFYKAVQQASIGAPDLPDYLSCLGELLRVRHNLTGRAEDLQEAFLALDQAWQRMPPDSPDLPSCLTHQGNLLRDRYARTGQLEDLNQAITIHRQVVDHTPPDSPQLAGYYNNLGLGLFERFDRTRQSGDLDEAMHLWQSAVEMTPPTSPQRADFLNSLGRGWRACYDLTQQLEYLDQALCVWQQAVDLVQGESPHLGMYLNNLGIGWRNHYQCTGQAEDLEKAIECYEQAVSVSPADALYTPKYLNNLGFAFRTRYDVEGREKDLDKARHAFERACKRGMEVIPEEALRSARNWGNWALGRHAWEEASEAYRYGLQATEQLLHVQLLRSEKEAWLRDAQGLPGDAAYALAKSGKLHEAAVTLETGLARLLGEALEQSSRDLERLPDLGHADLLERYLLARERITTLQTQVNRADEPETGGSPARAVAFSQALQAARAELDSAIEAIREIPGYTDFFQAPSFERVAKGDDSKMPLAYLLATPVGSLALIVQRSDRTPQVSPVWLDDFTTDDLGDILYDQDGVPGYLHGIVQAEIGVLGGVLDEIWPKLRKEIMAPLVARLQDLGYREAVLIPVGTLSLLSLHAVVFDQIVFTFAPSVRALQSVQADTDAVEVTPSLLGIGNPVGYGQQALAFARFEVEEIAALFAEQGYQHSTFYEASATRDNIAACFSGATHLHFSCHGRFEVDSPLDSALYLAGEDTLTLRDLLDGGLDVSAARLAVLSACQTGITDFQNVPDEAVGFPAGFIQAGVPGVISTLWPVNAVSTAVLLRQFYFHHLEEGLGPAVALHKAQLWLRDATVAEMKLAEYYEQLYQASGRRDRDALKMMRYYRTKLEEKLFAHPYYWAAFIFSGV